MELIRSLALLAEEPGPEMERAAEVLGLGPVPSAAEHTDVFLFQLYPYASVYLGGEGQMGGEARDRIAGFWRALGETPPPESDHLAVMLAAYAELAEREAASAEDDAAAARWRHARSAFLWEHLLSWLPVYLDKLREIETAFYGEWRKLLSAVLLEEALRLRAPDVLPAALRDAPPLGELDEAGGEEFLAAVTTPARTGMILLRADLERCARSLGMGLRKGERRYALKGLLGQAPRETLGWLAGEAGRQSAMHAQRHEAYRVVSEYWRTRASETAVVLGEAAKSLATA